ncbi:wd-40 repeat-containing protein [Leptolyngbya sp. Heron Island J]|uniref:nSTAND1 domain-containing NTPase n=1 Tax=Leptolyngbya sp. Heron Island J TaxID=1385935 RepID=UPI0003B96ECC|nr:TIR domain-containing protein [Leptolyngbya sp. Heron Island J]ESA37116.1 wd-40 repeat-containing protein [Leptolyngbya sp. Heron Island J]
MTKRTKQYDLFISYADADREWVEGYLLDSLQQAGVTYITESAFTVGGVRLLEFERAIQQSHRTLLVVSSAYLADGVNQFISLLSQTYGMETQTWPVIPMLLQSVSLPLTLRALVPLKATEPEEWGESVERLCTDLNGAVIAPVPPPSCPYPGMVSFGIEDSNLFFGRDQEIEELQARLRLHSFITVIGPSGSGKSSLVFAGLIPALQQSRLFGSGDWQIRVMRPGEAPLTTLSNMLSGSLDLQQTTKKLLIVDQFEEVFTVAGTEAEPFQVELLKLSTTPNVYLVLTVRADFYSELMSCPLWHRIQNHRLEVVPLKGDCLRQAILEPANSVGVFIEAALLERLLVDAAEEPGVLPLIQETLVLLWENLERRFLPLRAYEALMLTRSSYDSPGHETRTGLQVAIARRADTALATLDRDFEKQQRISRRIFLRLVQFGEGRADTRRQQPLDELRSSTDDPTLFDQTMEHLVRYRLLTLSGGERNLAKKVDIAHEALITSWPALQQWISERREAEQTRRRLAAKAEEWERLGHGSGGLLDAVELAEAERWLSSPDAIELGFGKALIELVDASRRAVEEALQLEEERQKREISLMQAALEKEQKARQAAQLRNRIAITASVIMTGLAGAIFYFWQVSEKQKMTAQLDAISASSESLMLTQRKFDALLEALRAGHQLQRQKAIPSATQLNVIFALQQAVYGIRERNRLQEHQLAVNSASYSPNGQLIASGDDDGVIKLWNLEGSVNQSFETESAGITTIDFSFDGKLIASGSADGTVKLWKLDGSVDRTYVVQDSAVTSTNFSPDGKWLIAAADNGTVHLLNLSQLSNRSWQAHEEITYSAIFASNGSLVTAGYDGFIKVWNLEGQLLNEWKGHEELIRSLALSPDGKVLASGSDDFSVKLWSLEGQLLQRLESHQKSINSVAFSPDSKTLATGSNDNSIKLWSQNQEKFELEETLHGHTDFINGVNFSPDGKTIVSASSDNSIRIWSRDSQEPKVEIEAIGFDGDVALDQISSSAISPDGRYVATVNFDNLIKIWDFEGRLAHSFTADHQAPVTGISFSPDNQMIATASVDSSTKLWSLEGSPIVTLNGHDETVTSVSFSPDGRSVLTTSFDKTVKLWDLDGSLKSTWTGHNDNVAQAVFAPDGRSIASVSWDYTLRTWSLDTTPLQTLEGYTDAIESVAFSPSGDHRIAAAGREGLIQLWSRDGHLLGKLQSPTGWIKQISFSPTTNFLATRQDNWDASDANNGLINIWSAGYNRPKQLPAHQGTVWAIHYRNDGTLISVGVDNTIALWSFDLAHLLETGCEWLQDYLNTNSGLHEDGRQICEE